jgi:hypothetical protein
MSTSATHPDAPKKGAFFCIYILFHFESVCGAEVRCLYLGSKLDLVDRMQPHWQQGPRLDSKSSRVSRDLRRRGFTERKAD